VQNCPTIGILGGYLYLGFRIMPGLTRVINHLSTFKSIIPCIERVYKECGVVIAKENYYVLDAVPCCAEGLLRWHSKAQQGTARPASSEAGHMFVLCLLC